MLGRSSVVSGASSRKGTRKGTVCLDLCLYMHGMYDIYDMHDMHDMYDTYDMSTKTWTKKSGMFMHCVAVLIQPNSFG